MSWKINRQRRSLGNPQSFLEEKVREYWFAASVNFQTERSRIVCTGNNYWFEWIKITLLNYRKFSIDFSKLPKSSISNEDFVFNLLLLLNNNLANRYWNISLLTHYTYSLGKNEKDIFLSLHPAWIKKNIRVAQAEIFFNLKLWSRNILEISITSMINSVHKVLKYLQTSSTYANSNQVIQSALHTTFHKINNL